MSQISIHPSRAVAAYKSDYAKIPFPAINTSGTDGGAPAAGEMIDGTKDFVALKVMPGDIVYNTTTGASATVASSPSPLTPDTLMLNATIFTGVGDSYVIYQAGPVSGVINRGCLLYVGTGGDLHVVTAGGDTVFMMNVPDGTLIPLQVVQILSATSATDILGLW